ncbi:hypothetical protein N0V95_009894 [Ascochyta clinopodiicola]|nr:hypothetical protein N0V95_009894 [Ascochyta clinopodiicola]
MLLLDLPPEVFQRVVTFYVCGAGIRKAAKSREVSRTFRDYINKEMFAEQPAAKFKARVPKKLLEKNLVSFLRYRLKSPNQASGFLLSLIHTTVDELMGFASFPANVPRDAVVEKVLQSVIWGCPHILNLTIAPSAVQLRDNKEHCITLGVALYCQNNDLVAAILDAGVDPWDRSNILGSGIHVATKLNNVPLVNVLLLATDKYDVGKTFKDRKRLQSRVILNSIHQALSDGNWAVAGTLLTWDSQHSPIPPLKVVGSWIERAAAANSVDFLKRAHELRYLRHKAIEYVGYIIKGLVKSVQPEPVLRYCIKEGLLCEHDKFLYGQAAQERAGGQHLLNLAVLENSVPLAKATFAVNAYGDMSMALRTAIQTGNVAMVRLLLENGADPEARVHPPVEKSTWELAGSTLMRLIVRQAVGRKIRALGTRYNPPHHVVRDVEKQKNTYVQYTFSALEFCAGNGP